MTIINNLSKLVILTIFTFSMLLSEQTVINNKSEELKKAERRGAGIGAGVGLISSAGLAAPFTAVLGANIGKMFVNKIELNPVINFKDNFKVSKEEMIKMQDRSHRYCFIANSLSDEVEVKIN